MLFGRRVVGIRDKESGRQGDKGEIPLAQSLAHPQAGRGGMLFPSVSLSLVTRRQQNSRTVR